MQGMSTNMDHSDGGAVATPRLLSSNAIEGISVFSRDGDKLGTVAAIMFDRFTGQAEYVVITMGRRLGLGGSYHPLPWSLVTFNPRLDGYVIGVEKTMLSSGPSFKSASEASFDEAYSQRIATYYAS